MTLKDIVYDCWKTAYKAGDSVIRSAYEQVKARIVNEEKSGKHELPLSDEIIQGCIQKVINELKESQLYYKSESESYQNVDIQLKELSRYMPKPLTDAEVIEMIKDAKAIESNPGKVIGIVAKQVGNRFDKSKIAGMVKNV